LSVWHIYIAGLCEHFRRTSALEGVPEGLQRAMLAFDLTAPIPAPTGQATSTLQHPWKAYPLREHADLVRQSYEAMARAKLLHGEPHVDGMRELLTLEEFAAFREDIVLGLLHDVPNANMFSLRELLFAALGTSPAHAPLIALADRALSGAMHIEQPQRDLWLATAWLLSPKGHSLKLERAAESRPEVVFYLRDLTGYGRHEAASGLTPSLCQIEFLVRLVGASYLPTEYPRGVSGGDSNAWDAVDYLRSLLGVLSANGAMAATDALSRLASDATRRR
jgi:hypothetical protein